MKKIFSLCAALALAFSLSAAALAAEVPAWLLEPSEAAALAEAEEQPAEIISVLLPTNPWVVVNPYGLRVEREGTASSEQVVSPVQTLVNCGAVPVRVAASAVGVVPPESGVTLVSAPPSGYGRDVFLYVEFQPRPEQWTGWFSGGENQLLVTPWGESKADVLTLEPYGEGYFHLSGGTSAPSEAWTEQDSVDVTLSFTFTPVYAEPVYAEPAPEMPEMPEAPEAPEMPEAPEVPEMPEVPETPEAPEENPDDPSLSVPEMPEAPPEESPDEVPDGAEAPEGTEQPEEPAEASPAGAEEAGQAVFSEVEGPVSDPPAPA